jgi:hypothetical protein
MIMENKTNKTEWECERSTELEDARLRHLEAQTKLLEAKAALVLAQAESVKRTSFPI